MTDGQIITLIIAIVVAISGFGFIFLFIRKSKQKTAAQPSIEVKTLLEALGGKENILATALDNKRLKLTLANPKLVSQTLLKSMGIAGFLTGKELKLLIKDNPLNVKTKLDQLISEVSK
ncbi:MAG TPA: hypothetical protein VK005_03085 [Acholeplasma sp.]|nr:hypothetical protein [Acholeplasma sp.]